MTIGRRKKVISKKQFPGNLDVSAAYSGKMCENAFVFSLDIESQTGESETQINTNRLTKTDGSSTPR